MSINRMYYGTKKIYSFLENGNTGGDCNCEQEYQNGYNQGYQDGQNSVECPECGSCNLGEGSILLSTNDVGKYELNASDDGYDGWSKFIVTLEGGGSEGGVNPFAEYGYSDEDMLNISSISKETSLNKLYEWDSSRDSAQEYFKEEEYGSLDGKRLVFAPMLDTSNVVIMNSMFYGCANLTYVPQYNTSNVTSMKDMFGRSGIKFLPAFDTSNVQDMGSFLAECTYLKTIPQLNFSNVNNIGEFFGYWQTPMNINDLGGFVGLKIDWNDGYGLNNCEKLTHTAIMNVINCLYDFRANGDNETIKTLKIHPATMTLLSEENILTATNKGWIISE